MATAVNFEDKISEVLECSVCMQLLHNPKSLYCNHTYCKVCLDGLLQFTDEEGSAKIVCPLRCEGETLIASDKTTNDLPIPHQLKSILELFNTQMKIMEGDGEKKYSCGETDQCKNDVSLYCKPCSTLICTGCREKHDDKHELKNYLPITVDVKSDTWMVVCELHNSLANFVCCNDELICIYCKHRKHSGHSCETVAESANRIRQFIINPRAAVEASIAHSRQLLEQCLKQRKMKCLMEYIAQLNREEEEILQELGIVEDEI